jgi:hypothetical protein
MRRIHLIDNSFFFLSSWSWHCKINISTKHICARVQKLCSVSTTQTLLKWNVFRSWAWSWLAANHVTRRKQTLIFSTEFTCNWKIWVLCVCSHKCHCSSKHVRFLCFVHTWLRPLAWLREYRNGFIEQVNEAVTLLIWGDGTGSNIGRDSGSTGTEWSFNYFPHFLFANSREVSQNRPRPPPPTSFTINFSLNHRIVRLCIVWDGTSLSTKASVNINGMYLKDIWYKSERWMKPA